MVLGEEDPAAQPPSAAGEADAVKVARDQKKAEKERQKAEKAKKLAEKQAKARQQADATASKAAQKVSKAMEDIPKYAEKTPAGEKKVLGPLDSPHHSAYIPGVVESAWDAWWNKAGFFEPEFTKDGEPLPAGTFVIPIPPPNITGKLHCGHALGTALQDMLIRWHRMRGFTTLYLPGCDHASISTQSVVEKMLWRKERKTRLDLGREKFLERALAWKTEYQGSINEALHRLGGSYDWTREAFTMDPALSDAVMEAFVRLYDEGLIYRSNRLVHWCCHLTTSLSTVETEVKELAGRTMLDVPGYERKIEFGMLTYFKYRLAKENGEPEPEQFIEVGTTRLETMLGDTAVAVHPDDPRYQSLHGKMLHHPFVDRLIPIITDTAVDREFGSGAVKITPAHDPNDFAMGQRHNLPFINILTINGLLNKNAGKFEGQKRYDVRYAVEAELQTLGLFSRKEANPMSIRVCAKTKDVIEPLQMPQWWMRMKDLAEPAMEVVRKGEVVIKPESADKSYFRWLENIQDWCLSRSLYWGHQIPAWKVVFEGEPEQSEEIEQEKWVVAKTEMEALEKAKAKYAGQKFRLRRDGDVLDTWFSSGLWPFATLGWPKKTHDFEKLFPTSLLESGWDILFFWIARMIMMSLRLTGKIPFSEVYCHSLIRDSQGRKMSKSLGNVLDPIHVMEGITLEALQEGLKHGNLDAKELVTATKNQKEQFPDGIPECGADALRFSLINYTTGGGDINFDVKIMAGYRRFCNKIYQATKYVLGKIPADYVPPAKLAMTGKETLPERWILHRLNAAATAIHQALSEREFSRSSQIVYHYWYDELCDVFIENSKIIIQQGTEEERKSTFDTLYAAVEGGLTMIHPFMPFLSEELWQRLPRRQGDRTPSIVKAAYPKPRNDLSSHESAEQYELLISSSKGLRSLLAEFGIKKDGVGYISCADTTESELIRCELKSIQALVGKVLVCLDLTTANSLPAGCAVYPISSTTNVYLNVGSHVDVSTLIEKTRAKLSKATDVVAKQRKLMAGEGWSEKVSAALRDAEEEKLRNAEWQIKSLESSIEQFKRLDLGK